MGFSNVTNSQVSIFICAEIILIRVTKECLFCAHNFACSLVEDDFIIIIYFKMMCSLKI